MKNKRVTLLSLACGLITCTQSPWRMLRVRIWECKCVGALQEVWNWEGLVPTLGEGHVLLPRGSFRQYLV